MATESGSGSRPPPPSLLGSIVSDGRSERGSINWEKGEREEEEEEEARELASRLA